MTDTNIDWSDLKGALDRYNKQPTHPNPDVQIVIKAANAFFATLPRKVAIKGYAVVCADGKVGELFGDRADAEYNARHDYLGDVSVVEFNTEVEVQP